MKKKTFNTISKYLLIFHRNKKWTQNLINNDEIKYYIHKKITFPKLIDTCSGMLNREEAHQVFLGISLSPFKNLRKSDEAGNYFPGNKCDFKNNKRC